jgi:hypothetical protein
LGVDDSFHCGAMVLKVCVMHMLVKTRCTCSCGMVLMMHVSTTGHPQNELVTGGTSTSWEGVCVASRILTTKIPSMLLVAVMWLQRTGCPRFRRGTFGYGTTTSPNKRDRVWVRSFHENACQYTQASQMHMLCNAYSKVTFIFIQKLWASPKRISSGLRDRIKQDWQETFWWVWDSSQNFWSDHNQHR